MMSDYEMSESLGNVLEEGDKTMSLEQIALGEDVLESPFTFDFPEKDVVDAKGEEPTDFKYEMDKTMALEQKNALGEGVLVSPNIIFDFPEKDVVDAKGEED